METKGFLSILNHLKCFLWALPASFENICYGSTSIINNYFTLSLWRWTLYVYNHILTSKVDPRTIRVDTTCTMARMEAACNKAFCGSCIHYFKKQNPSTDVINLPVA